MFALFTGLFTTGKKCSEEVMGYEVYTSALADVLCEPSLTMPLTVGMYARWGSGKSFVLRRLQGMNSTSFVAKKSLMSTFDKIFTLLYKCFGAFRRLVFHPM